MLAIAVICTACSPDATAPASNDTHAAAPATTATAELLQSTEDSIPEAAELITEASAIELAREAVESQETWADRAIFEVIPRANGWIVVARRVEAYDTDGHPLFSPGGHRTITITAHGKILDYGRGR